MKIRLILGLLFASTAFAQSSDFTQNFGAVPPINRGQIVKMSSTGQVVPMLTTDTTGALGIATTSTTSSNVLVTLFGAPLVAVDGSCTPGNVVLISTTVAGQGHCASAASNQVIGIATTTASNGFATVQLAPLSSAGASGVAPNNPLPASSSGPGPVFNVKNYGAKGDFKSNPSITYQNGNTTVSCAACFVSADAGAAFFASSALGGGAVNLGPIVSITDTSHAVLTTAPTFSNTSQGSWGHDDTTFILNASAAALAVAFGLPGQGNTNTKAMTFSPALYFPAGNYMVCNIPSGVLNIPSTVSGMSILGDGPHQSTLSICGAPTLPGAFALINVASGANNVRLENMSFDGVFVPIGVPPISILGNANIFNVEIFRWNGPPGFTTSGGGLYNLLSVFDNSNGINCNSCQAEFHDSGASNNTGYNLLVQNTVGLNTSAGVRFTGATLIDECTTTNNCTQFVNAHDVWLIGAALFGTPGGSCANIDGNSFVHWLGGICGTFGTDNNVNGPKIAAGGQLQASDLRSVSTGTGKCITNSGSFYDNGGNSCESQFIIASGTSTGTTAVLTLTTAGANVNTNCSIGDSLLVEGAVIAGYDGYFSAGITATTATTLTYTTQGSNLGALGAGGIANCRNLQTYSGTLPKALLNNPIPNTCYITGTFAATTAAAPMCAFKLGSATNINFIKATSTTTTACTVAPVVTISDGTVSETLTITTAKSIWDSSVDASTGVGTSIFKPNGTITLSNTVGTCTTPPTNFGVSYNISPILSN